MGLRLCKQSQVFRSSLSAGNQFQAKFVQPFWELIHLKTLHWFAATAQGMRMNGWMSEAKSHSMFILCSYSAITIVLTLCRTQLKFGTSYIHVHRCSRVRTAKSQKRTQKVRKCVKVLPWNEETRYRLDALDKQQLDVDSLESAKRVCDWRIQINLSIIVHQHVRVCIEWNAAKQLEIAIWKDEIDVQSTKASKATSRNTARNMKTQQSQVVLTELRITTRDKEWTTENKNKTVKMGRIDWHHCSSAVESWRMCVVITSGIRIGPTTSWNSEMLNDERKRRAGDL